MNRSYPNLPLQPRTVLGFFKWGGGKIASGASKKNSANCSTSVLAPSALANFVFDTTLGAAGAQNAAPKIPLIVAQVLSCLQR